ncbi:MAG: hypothetical protein ACRD2N_18885 [Vicinamibacterales bacterium]
MLKSLSQEASDHRPTNAVEDLIVLAVPQKLVNRRAGVLAKILNPGWSVA